MDVVILDLLSLFWFLQSSRKYKIMYWQKLEYRVVALPTKRTYNLDENAKQPVIVFLHGGAFVVGSCESILYGPEVGFISSGATLQ